MIACQKSTTDMMRYEMRLSQLQAEDDFHFMITCHVYLGKGAGLA